MHCAIDFGTSNSGIAVSRGGAMRPVELEPGRSTIPTAVFYYADEPLTGAGPEGLPRAFGQAAVAAYVDGIDGRLMRSMKTILGSEWVERSTDVGGGRSVRYLDVVAGYLRHLKRRAEADSGATLRQAVLGRPVFFVDDDPVRDRQAEASLEAAARSVGFGEVRFQFEPIAAAFDHEQRIDREQILLVADIGGGTSDFSVVRVGPDRIDRPDRHDDILGNHGVHVAGTDFDRRVALRAILPELGFGSRTVRGRDMPNAVYHDLATWHLINTVYGPSRVAELRAMRREFAEPRLHERLMAVLDRRLGHDLLGRAERAKIAVAAGGSARIDLDGLEPEFAKTLAADAAAEAIESEVAAIVAAALEAVRRAGVGREAIDALYFTGGSTGLGLLTRRLADAFPHAAEAHGDRFASVVHGLGLQAERLFGR